MFFCMIFLKEMLNRLNIMAFDRKKFFHEGKQIYDCLYNSIKESETRDTILVLHRFTHFTINVIFAAKFSLVIKMYNNLTRYDVSPDLGIYLFSVACGWVIHAGIRV